MNFNNIFNSKHNEYYFNNSIIVYKKYVLMTYRFIRYDIDKDIHPWDIWTSNYSLGKINYFEETDTTGLCILKKKLFFKNKYKIIFIKNNFLSNYDVDCRLIKIKNEIFLTYNKFNNIDNILQIMIRKIKINILDKKIKIFKEKKLLDNRKDIEKNCILDKNKIILYEINGYFKYIYKNLIYVRKVDILYRIINYYDNKLVFSLGTPVEIIYINNQKLYLSLGHLKIIYKLINKNTPIYEFINKINWSIIKEHGYYIYFMFFFVFDSNYNIIYLSYPFIPNNILSSYLLVFPMGLVRNKNSYYITYGEGDEYSNMLILKKKEILNLLVKKENININNYKLYFYNIKLKCLC